jgi:hypothetical protein
MFRWLWACVLCLVAAAAACGATCAAAEADAASSTSDLTAEDVASGPPPAGSAADALPPGSPPPADAGTATDPPPNEPPRSADGTTSVVAAAPPVADRPLTPPAAQTDQAALPATTTATGPPATAAAEVSVPPPGLAEPLLAGVLEPMKGRPSDGGGAAAGPPAQLYARPLPLLEALERSGDRARRLWITQAYWKTAQGYALVRWSTEAIDRLELIAPGGDPHDRATLDVATAAARADLADARAQLGAAQQELVDLARLPVSEPLPWPVDRPLAGPYETHFEAIFATRVVTGRVRAIARTLPARHEAVESRAAAVRAAETAMAMAEADHAKGKRPIEAVVAAHAAVVAQQREFLQAVKVYNLEIAEYAMAVADLSVPDDRFVSMLIPAPVRWRSPDAAAVTPPAAVVAVP